MMTDSFVARRTEYESARDASAGIVRLRRRRSEIGNLPGRRIVIRAKQLLAVAGLVLAVAFAGNGGASAAGRAATVRTFAGPWYGHTRGLSISSKGHAVESISDGCCDRIVVLHMTLYGPRGTATNATVLARVTFVHIYEPSAFGPKFPPPHPGEVTILRLNNGVITEPLTRINYCDLASDEKGTCGA